jgi:hypothetical protein
MKHRHMQHNSLLRLLCSDSLRLKIPSILPCPLLVKVQTLNYVENSYKINPIYQISIETQKGVISFKCYLQNKLY